MDEKRLLLFILVVVCAVVFTPILVAVGLAVGIYMLYQWLRGQDVR